VIIDTEKRIQQIQKYIERMPGLSTTVSKVLEICNNAATSPNDLNRVISLDPVLTGQVLKLINSAYYSLPNKISSLTRAVIMLGVNTVKNLVLGSSIISSVGSVKPSKIFSMDEFWEHSLAVGVTAKALAIRGELPANIREEFFVAGLLHDLGKIPMNNRFPEEYTMVLDIAAEKKILLANAERELFGFDHGVVGEMIAEKWQLTPALKHAMHYHHHPDSSPSEDRGLTKFVALGNMFINIIKIGGSGEAILDKQLLTELLEEVGISQSEIAGLRATILKEIEKAKIFLDITSKG
jgi:putative nucleotidyltransferase with HDIG domain